MSALTIKPMPMPLSVDAAEEVRVGGKGVLLDYVVEEFEQGATPEMIIHTYDTLKLADVYAALAYYLAYQDDVREYMETRRRKVEEQYLKDRARPESLEIRARIRARQTKLEQERAASTQ